MATHRIFQIPDGENKVIFIPDLQKLYLVSASQILPDYIESDQPVVVRHCMPDLKFRATQLIINNICNLRCIYCYANAGEQKPQIMPLEIACAAIDKVIADTKELEFPLFEVSIIGGEPTCSSRLLKDIVRYARRRAKDCGLTARIGIVSNGVFGHTVRQFISANLDYITFSLDGPAEIHDKQRPMRNSRGSFKIAFDNAKNLYNSGMTIGLRCTVSSLSVPRLSEIIEFFHGYFSKATIGVEPLQECGRCKTSGALSPDSMEYARSLISALVIAKSKDIHIKTSILKFAREANRVSFCGVNGQNFAINPEGFVTACTRVTSREDCMASIFYYGRYDHEKKEFVFDQERYSWLKTLVVDSIKNCDDCFAKFNYKGDCPIVKSDCSANFAMTPSKKCEAIKAITIALFKIQLELISRVGRLSSLTLSFSDSIKEAAAKIIVL
ncbi:MAG: radical SAM protein [Candidatus Azambacteria bacterium]|nr:radical SAM protein [Candidatus Azambacteria bacterium]